MHQYVHAVVTICKKVKQPSFNLIHFSFALFDYK